MTIATTVEKSPPRLAQPMAYGCDYDLQRWSGELAADRRWESSFVVAREAERVVGCLPVWHSASPAPPASPLTTQVAALGLAAGRRYLHLGSHSRLIGGAAVLERSDRWAVEQCLTALVGGACEAARALGIQPVALYVPHGQLPAFLRSWPTPPTLHQAEVFSRIDVRLDSAGRLYHPSKRVREVWKRDARDLVALGLTPAWQTIDGELIAEAAPLVAAVVSRNGRRTDHRLVAMELRRWWSFEPSTARALVVRAADGRLIGATFARGYGKSLELYELGMSDTFGDRRSLYATLGFVEPLRLAVATGMQTLELGVGHPLPKRIRGAVQEPLWHIR